MAEIVRRRSCGGVLPLGRHASISGFSFVHSASPSIAPPHFGEAKRPHTERVQGRTGRSIACGTSPKTAPLPAQNRVNEHLFCQNSTQPRSITQDKSKLLPELHSVNSI